MCNSQTVASLPLPPVRTPEEAERNRRQRLPFLTLGLSFFVAALYGGLWRLGWPLPHAERLGEIHGPLMICGFFGTLIGLERAVALGKTWAFAAPLLSCGAALALVAGMPQPFAAWGFVAASAILASASLDALRDNLQLFTMVLAGGAACWGVGDLVWQQSGAVALAAPWWLLFLVLTIAAERLEASLLGAVRNGAATFCACAVALVVGAGFGVFDAVGSRVLGGGFIALALWLLRHDIAFRNLRGERHPRFLGFCMSAGYFWLAVAGTALIFAPPFVAPYGYDLALHAILIGFVISMAMGHSGIVIPAITGAAAPYHPAMYVGLTLLHASVAARLFGDLWTFEPARMASGALTLAGMSAFGLVLGWRIATARVGRRGESALA
jgi:hypothetical protein